MLRSNSDPLSEVERRLAVRDRIDEAHRGTQRRLPASGNAALSASALIQAALGVEFTLSGLNKLSDPHYATDFNAFVRSNPGAMRGILSGLIQTLVLPHAAFFARLIEISELLLGVVLLVGAIEIGRRRFAGRLGAQHGYEAPLALVSSAAGLAVTGLSLSIALVMGEGFPTITPGRAFTTAIPVELLIIPLGLAVAWLEFGRFIVLRRSPVPERRVTGRRILGAVEPGLADNR